MVILKFSGLDMFLVGELGKEIHSKIAASYGLDDEDVILQASDSFLFHKGVEQTSFNLLVEVVAPEDYIDSEEMVASILMEASKNYSVHVRILFSYYDPTHYYERVNKDYPEYITEMQDVEIDESEYNEESEYDEDSLYTGNMFEDMEEEEDRPVTLNDFFKRKKKLDYL